MSQKKPVRADGGAKGATTTADPAGEYPIGPQVRRGRPRKPPSQVEKRPRGRPRKYLDNEARKAAHLQRAKFDAPPGFRTRIQLREILDLSEAELKSAENLGTVRPSKYSPYKTPLYSDRAVQNFLNRKADGSLWRQGGVLTSLDVLSYSAEEAKAVYDMLDADVKLTKITRDTGIHPEVVLRIQQAFDLMDGRITLPGNIVAQMNALKRLQGSFPLKTAADVLEVMQLAEDDRICPTCRVNGSISLCAPCARDQFGAAPNRSNEGPAQRKGPEAEVSSPAVPPASTPCDND